MKKITLKQLVLTNFKGIKSLSIDFDPITTVISGENGTGKTTVYDAFNFLLFGKDSSDRKDFNIKTLDKYNNPIHKLNHEVIGVFDVDGVVQTFKRCYKEKWVKQRGQEVAEMNGHETVFYFNDVPLSKSEYEAKVSALVSEDTMKLLTNPLYFNTIKWDQRRKILMDIVGEISNDEMIAKILTPENAYQADELAKILKEGKSVDEWKRQLAAKRKILNDELSSIPTRIDEATRSMPKVENWEKVNKDINETVAKINVIDKAIEDKNTLFAKEREDAQRLQHQKHNLEMQLQALQAKNKLEANKGTAQLQNDIQVINQNIANLKRQVEENNRQVSHQNNTINQLNASKTNLLQQWREENAKELQINVNELNCPACKQPLPQTDTETKTEELKKNFNTNKVAILQRLKLEGENLKNSVYSAENIVKQLDEDLNAIQLQIQEAETKLLELKSKQVPADTAIVPTQEEIDLQAQIDAIVIPPIQPVNVDELKSTRLQYTVDLDVLKAKLSNKEQIDKINVRIAELKEQEKTLAQQISTIEKTEFVVQEFNTAKVKELDNRLTQLFPMVQFRLFNPLINGGVEPACEMMVNGVNFSDVNTAGKINAGLSIINVLVDYYNVSAPIFIDNKESINNPITCDKSQVVYLTVSNDSKLTIS